MSRLTPLSELGRSRRLRRLAIPVDRWHRLSIRRRILVAMLAVSVIPLGIFASAGLVALSGLNSGALRTASAELDSSQGVHLADLVLSKSEIVDNELESIQNQLALVSQSASNALDQPPAQVPSGHQSAGIAIYGPGSADGNNSAQVRALSSLGSQLSQIFNWHTEVTCVWVQLPQTGLLAVSPAGILSPATQTRYLQLLPPESYYQKAVVRQQAAFHNPNSHWSRLVPAPSQDSVWTSVYSNPLTGGATVSEVTAGTAATGEPYRIGANITVSHIVS